MMRVPALLALFLAAAANPRVPAKPNIIYILADDAGTGDLSCYGQRKFRTPNIDGLAKEGLRFTQHYSGSTVCAPSRCSLMTGFHTGHCYVRGNKEHRPIGQEPIPSSTVTVAKVLKGAGYATGAFGKWGLGYPGSEGDPVRQGFDAFYGYNCQRNAHTYYPKRLFDGGKKVELDGKTYAHDLIMERALGFIRENKEKPFFCFMPVTIPHAAMHVPEKYAAPFRKEFPQFENKIGRYAGPPVKNPIAAFAGMMTKLDEDVGRVRALLEELGIAERTLVLFTSDNGPHLEGGHDPRFFDSNGPLRGHKRDLYEGGIRVPLVAWWPGSIKGGGETDHPSAFWDFLPTACEMAGLDPPAGIDGISFLPTLLGKADAQKKHDYLYWEFYAQGGKRAVRLGDWKGVQLKVHEDRNGPVQLFNLKSDLGETKNVASDHPEIVAKIREIMAGASAPSDIFRWREGKKR